MRAVAIIETDDQSQEGDRVSPGGHLVTTIAACGATAAVTGSLALTAGVAVGGFLIDVDHAIDYVLVDRQRDLRPATFLRYYVEAKVERTLLFLHSYELFAILAAMAWWLEIPVLAGYLLGGLMHLALDIAFNGKLTPHNIWAFYSFAYRARHRFQAAALLGRVDFKPMSRSFWSGFFRGAERRPGSTFDAPRIVPSPVRKTQPSISTTTHSTVP
jgi:hypothetical protein